MSTQPWGEGFLKNIIIFHFLHSSLAGTFHLSVKAKVKNTLWLHLGPTYRHMSQIHKFSHKSQTPTEDLRYFRSVIFSQIPKEPGT